MSQKEKDLLCPLDLTLSFQNLLFFQIIQSSQTLALTVILSFLKWVQWLVRNMHEVQVEVKVE